MNCLPQSRKLCTISLPSLLKVLRSIESMCMCVMYVGVSVFTHTAHISVFEINHECHAENFAFKVLSLILYHKVNTPKSSFTFLDE